VIASDAAAPAGSASYHGTWQQVDAFRYSMSLVRKTPTGWERVRVVFSHVRCDDLIGQQKYDTLTCPVAGNANCDPEGTGWVNHNPGATATTDGTPTDVRLDKYARYPFSYNAQ
jgi:hypothetical protein